MNRLKEYFYDLLIITVKVVLIVKGKVTFHLKKALYKIDHLRKSAIFDHAKYFEDFRKRLQLIIFDGGVFPMVSMLFIS